jgi:osmotically-inducible protein OsmY
MRSLLLASILIAPLPLVVACGGGSAVSATIDDATITTRVKTSLLNEPGVAAQRIDVSTTGGVVTLSGVVKSADEEQHAIAAARRVGGVRDVKSQLKIEGA